MKHLKKYLTLRNITYSLIAGIIILLGFIGGYFLAMIYHIPKD